MIAIYVAYGEPITEHILRHNGRQTTKRIEPGEERHVIDCLDEDHAAKVADSWIRDPATISVRAVRQTP